MKRIHLMVALLPLLGATPLIAQNTDRIHTVDGSIYEGYIAEQVPGKNIVVNTEKVILFLPKETVIDIITENVAISDLPVHYQVWASDRDPNASFLQLSDIKLVNNLEIPNAVLLEEGDRIKIIAFIHEPFDLKWKDIVKTSKLTDKNSASHGISDVIFMSDGVQYEGHIIEQSLKNSEIRIKTNDGKVFSANMKNVMAIRSNQKDKSISLWEQVRFFDKLHLTSGETITGFITTRMMGKDVTILDRYRDVTQIIELKSIVKYQKVANPQYREPIEQDTVAVSIVEEDIIVEQTIENEPVPTTQATAENDIVEADIIDNLIADSTIAVGQSAVENPTEEPFDNEFGIENANTEVTTRQSQSLETNTTVGRKEEKPADAISITLDGESYEIDSDFIMKFKENAFLMRLFYKTMGIEEE